jgi:hypothetical protein
MIPTTTATAAEGTSAGVSSPKSSSELLNCHKSKFQLRNERLSTRKVLRKLFNLTYTVTDAVALNAIRRQLETVHSDMAKVADEQVVEVPVATKLSLYVRQAETEVQPTQQLRG